MFKSTNGSEDSNGSPFYRINTTSNDIYTFDITKMKFNQGNQQQLQPLLQSNTIISSSTTASNTVNNKPIEVDQVGFSSLPEQVHRKSLKKGFEFTLLVIGDSGLGKSTLVNSLFMTDLYADRTIDSASERVKKTVKITSRTAELEEKGVRLKLTVVDTPGFGDSINLNDSWEQIEDYIDKQFNLYYQHETGYGMERKKLRDTRIHCCLYFIPPYVRGLRPIDIETMKALQSKVNIVPVIAKADSLTKKELELVKSNVLADIDKHFVKIYEFPICDSDDDDSFKKIDQEIKNAIPFGIIGSNTVIESGNKRVRGRVYPWGIIDIESDSTCDFSKLRTFLCSSHMQDLKDLTHDVHYENYRTEHIKSQKQTGPISPKQNQLSIDETDKLLFQKDLELKKMQELITKMKLNIGKQPTTQIINNNSYSNGNTSNLTSFGHGKNGNYNTQQPYNNGNNYHQNYAKILNHAVITNSTPI